MKPSEKVIDLFQKVILGNDNSAKHQIISIVREVEQALEKYADKNNWQRFWNTDDSIEVDSWQLTPDGNEIAKSALQRAGGKE